MGRKKQPSQGPQTPSSERGWKWLFWSCVGVLVIGFIALLLNERESAAGKQSDGVPPAVVQQAQERPQPSEDPDEVVESDARMRARLYPTDGYIIFPEAKDVPWVDLLVPGEWTPQEEQLVKTSLSLLVKIEGKESRIGQLILGIPAAGA